MEDRKSVVVLDEDADYGGGGGGGVDIIRGIKKLLDDDHKVDFDNLKQSVNKSYRNNDDDDDDCVVLDEDPDKPRMVEKKKDESGDDLVVVSEKGEVACRDFPHPRHLCVKFPFSSSRHDLHCDQCHCYVCDSLAPCVNWGGASSFDHCHATEKQAFWKSKRSLRNVGLPVHIPHIPPVHQIATSLRIPPVSDRSPPLVPQNHGLRQLETTVNSVASTDFPHPRHLCVKYPFSSSRHDMHCDQCHCYVCDSLAPCVHWGGASSFDHCHATENQAFWKSQRSLRNVGLPVHIPKIPPVHQITTSMRIPPVSDKSPPLVPQNHNLRQLENTVASTDLAHPRHFCVKYPFSSSRHDMHCDQCHCFVCDSPAPCVDWGTGVSSFDHCHATDEHAFWKSQRRKVLEKC